MATPKNYYNPETGRFRVNLYGTEFTNVPDYKDNGPIQPPENNDDDKNNGNKGIIGYVQDNPAISIGVGVFIYLIYQNIK